MPRRAAIGYHLALAAGLFAAGCNSTGPSFEYGDLRAVLVVDPDIVATNDRFDVRVDLINTGEQTIELTPGGCHPLVVSVTHRGEPLPGAFTPPNFFCPAIGSVHKIPPGGRISPKLSLVANVTKGTFEVRVGFNYSEGLPTLAAKLRVE